jgi:RNA polymerase sigma-70 factor, ECF subfamily
MNSLPLEDDVTLVSRILAGEPRLFERLVRRYNQRLYRGARAHLGNDAEAEDVVQQAWLSIFRSLHQWTGRGSFSGWALTIVINACRKQRGPMRDSIDDSEPDELTSSLAGPEEEVHRHQLREVLTRNVDALPPKLRTVLVLCDVEGLSGPEVSQALGVSEEAVRVRLHRARRSLQAALEVQLAGEGKELFAFMGARCDAMTASVLGALHLLPPSGRPDTGGDA